MRRISNTPVTVKPDDPIRADDFNHLAFAIEEVRIGDRRISYARRRPWAELMLHEVLEVFGDYLRCRRIWRGQDLETADRGILDVFVARPQRVRASTTTENIGGTVITYAQVDVQTRTADSPGETQELQKVTPPYHVGELITVTVQRGYTGIIQVDEQRGRPVETTTARAYATEPA